MGLDQCNFDNSLLVADVGKVFNGYEITFDEAGMFYFSCSIGFHCQAGQKLTVEVKDPSEGLRCHDHDEKTTAKQVSMKYTSAEYGDGQVNARVIDSSSSVPITANECGDFCTPPSFLSLLPGIEEGSCSELGFIYNPENRKVRFPNSPVETDLTVVSNVNNIDDSEDSQSFGCHCHSYEKISCPEEETPNDFLYEEHIEEIENYCSGILD